MAKKSKSFDFAVYQKINVNDLILFAIASILEKKEICTFERLVKECFIFFPKSFSFSPASEGRGSSNNIGRQNQNWPDSRKIDRPLRTLRSKKLISGDPQRFFFLTKTGKKRTEEIGNRLRQESLKL